MSGESALRRLRAQSSAHLAGRIARLKSANLATLSDYEISNRVKRICDAYATRIAILETNRLLRARKNVEGVSFHHASDLWYPPANVVGIGRFNDAHQPVFYASSTFSASIYEVRPTVGDRVTVMVCGGPKAIIELNLCHLGLHHFEGAQNGVNVDIADLHGQADFVKKLHDAGILNKWKRIDAFLSDAAIFQPNAETEKDFYRLTGAIGHLLQGMPGIDGMTYPSVAADRRAFSLRLNTVAADSVLFPAEVWEVDVVDHQIVVPGAPVVPNGHYLLEFRRQSKSIEEDGAIVWKDTPLDPPADIAAMSARVTGFRNKMFPEGT